MICLLIVNNNLNHHNYYYKQNQVQLFISQKYQKLKKKNS